MTIAPFIETIHILCGVTFFGLMIASFVYVISSVRQNDPTLFRYCLKVSLYGDVLIFPIIVVLFLTGTFMVYHHHLPMNTPWIIVAYCALSVVSVLWFLLVLIKLNAISTNAASLCYRKSFVMVNVIIILVFCMIIHDAITQQTWLWR